MDRSREEQELDYLDRLKEVIDSVAERPYEATSDDGMVKVTAVATGQVIGLEINPRVYRNPDSVGLASTILTTLNQAISGASTMHFESLERASGTQAGTFRDLFQGATDLIEELMDDADDMRRR